MFLEGYLAMAPLFSLLFLFDLSLWISTGVGRTHPYANHTTQCIRGRSRMVFLCYIFVISVSTRSSIETGQVYNESSRKTWHRLRDWLGVYSFLGGALLVTNMNCKLCGLRDGTKNVYGDVKHCKYLQCMYPSVGVTMLSVATESHHHCEIISF